MQANGWCISCGVASVSHKPMGGGVRMSGKSGGKRRCPAAVCQAGSYGLRREFGGKGRSNSVGAVLRLLFGVCLKKFVENVRAGLSMMLGMLVR